MENENRASTSSSTCPPKRKCDVAGIKYLPAKRTSSRVFRISQSGSGLVPPPGVSTPVPAQGRRQNIQLNLSLGDILESMSPIPAGQQSEGGSRNLKESTLELCKDVMKSVQTIAGIDEKSLFDLCADWMAAIRRDDGTLTPQREDQKSAYRLCVDWMTSMQRDAESLEINGQSVFGLCIDWMASIHRYANSIVTNELVANYIGNELVVHTGMNHSDINMLFTRQFFSNESCVPETCAICAFGYQDGVTLKMLPCLHEFHNPCITMWLMICRACPVCVKDVQPLRKCGH